MSDVLLQIHILYLLLLKFSFGKQSNLLFIAIKFSTHDGEREIFLILQLQRKESNCI